jgi:hypothetical protein
LPIGENEKGKDIKKEISVTESPWSGFYQGLGLKKSVRFHLDSTIPQEKADKNQIQEDLPK